ncbi:ATP-binding protein [Massiliimalia timonensis]|uniref:ATP-binding protein n=1 Tax=Massiliimalia timonensis TaxID=1987501 RepID=UPI000B8AD069|nr:ATP-binding protein [Massiliimalia timonensis]MBS7174674.1 ATP-binding protein [Clostridiales bacterium]
MDKGIYVLDMLSGVSVYHHLREDKLVKRFCKLFRALEQDPADFDKISRHYSKICTILYESEFSGSLPDYLFDKILCDENVYSVMCAQNKYNRLTRALKKAAEFDLNVFYLLSLITSKEIKQAITDLFPEKAEMVKLFAEYSNEKKRYRSHEKKWGDDLAPLGDYHRRNGTSVFTKYYAFFMDDHKEIVPVKHFEPFRLNSLKKYELQKRQVIENTLSFLNGKPANNVLLYGDRGTGKSTTVKAVLNEFHQNGLRMIQVSKEDIIYLHKVLKFIENNPLKFIIFIDDLTFQENDECFNTLKAVLEGSLNELPKNVLIYATTNRRHLIKETFSSREGNELHASDTRDESASLADRFGLVVTFTKPNLNEFMDIVCEIAKERGLEVDEESLKKGANIFAMKKASRSGRVARQYIDYVEGRLSLGLPPVKQ